MLNKSSALYNNLLSLQKEIQSEGIDCHDCFKLQQLGEPGSIKFMNHMIFYHCEFRIRQCTFYQNNLQKAYSELNSDDLAILCREGFIFVDDDNNYQQVEMEQQRKTHLLLMSYKKQLRSAISFSYSSTDSERICIIYNVWHKRVFLLDIGVSLQELIRRCEKKRAGKIILAVQHQDLWIYQRLKFQITQNDQVKKVIDKYASCGNQYLQIEYKTAEYVRSYVLPRRSLYLSTHNKKAEILKLLINGLIECGLLDDLKEYLSWQMKNTSQRSNNSAVPKDQVRTPNFIFKYISRCLKASKREMFDVCMFIQDWNKAVHYNGLTDEWVGELIFINPPFSVGSWFVTKIFIEFLQGKNIVAILPEFSTENSFGAMLFRMLGTVFQLGHIPFHNNKNTLTTAVSVIFLLQPEYINQLKPKQFLGPNKNNFNSQGLTSRKEAQNQVIAMKHEQALRLLEQKLSSKQIQKLAQLSQSTITKLRREGKFERKRRQIIAKEAQVPENASGQWPR